MTERNPNATSGEAITIRRAETIADYRACQDAQRRAWGIAEDGYVVPIATMVGANLHGGLVLGAFRDCGEAVAMSFGFLGRIGDRLCLYSQLTGVVPEYQSRGLGYEIKLRQREFARAEAIGRIAWAFDPLQVGNAHFNLTRLGAAAESYVENMYGERTDALNRGVPTDRLIVEWETSPEAPVTSPPEGVMSAPRLIARGLEQGAHHRSGEWPVPRCVATAIGSPRLLLEVPAEVGRMRREQPARAEAWRVAVGQAFRTAFDAGYRAVHFAREESSGLLGGFYVLERRDGR
jgi:predicted GNAT superfamily acetyltransferase